jgi:SAM-dependent MidA family methyltransferase
MKKEFPALTVDEQAHERRVITALVDAIDENGGYLPFREFMNIVLYAPTLGYYAVGTHKLGPQGDFSTAPEMSPLLAQAMATQCVDILRECGPSAGIMELGPGSGRLAFDVLATCERLGCLPKRYDLLEISPDLRQRQRQLLAQGPDHWTNILNWLDRLPETPWSGVVLGNEVVDALPVECFEWRQGQWWAMGVTHRDGRLGFDYQPATANDIECLKAHIPEPIEGERRETRSMVKPWIESVLHSLKQGVALWVDYGGGSADVYAADRTLGTLSCFYKHRQHDDVFVACGLQDITAWVDFSSLTNAAVDCGAELLGFTTQSSFILNNDFDKHFEFNQTQFDPLTLAQAAKRLLMPTDMGERFKVLALGKNVTQPLRGFRKDLSYLL